MIHYALLLDGGFVRRRLGSAKRPATIDDIRTLVGQIAAHPSVVGMRLHRVYYYDAAPLESTESKPLGGAPVDFSRQPAAQRSQQLFSDLGHEPFTALRLGELSFEGWSVSPRTLDKAAGTSVSITETDLRPQITQKGVDMRIGLDIAALTLKKQADVIVLVTGDSDFVPAMKFARREGAQLFLVPLGHGIKENMREHADLILAFPPNP